MFNADTDFIFPSRVVPELRALRGSGWEAIVDRAHQAAPVEPVHLGFVLLMIGLNGCESCNADSFKAMRGCSACSIQTIERYSGTDAELQGKYEESIGQVGDYLASTSKLAE